MLLQILRDAVGAFRVLLQPQRHCAHTACQKPRLMRVHRRTDERALVVLDALDDLPACDERTAHDVRVTAEILCDRMTYNVDAVCKRMLVQRCCVGVVNDSADAVLFCDCRDGGKILHPENETGRTFQNHQRRFRTDGAADLLRVAAFHRRICHTPSVMQIAAHKRKRASVRRVHHHDVTARAHEMQNRRGDRAHSGAEAQRTVAALQRGNLALGKLYRRIGGAGIGVIGVFDAVDRRRLDKQRVLEDRRDNRTLKAPVFVAEMCADVLGGFVASVVFGQKCHNSSPELFLLISSVYNTSSVFSRARRKIFAKNFLPGLTGMRNRAIIEEKCGNTVSGIGASIWNTNLIMR